MILCNDAFIIRHLPPARVPRAEFGHSMDHEPFTDRLGLMDATSNASVDVPVGRDWLWKIDAPNVPISIDSARKSVMPLDRLFTLSSQLSKCKKQSSNLTASLSSFVEAVNSRCAPFWVLSQRVRPRNAPE